MFIIIMLKNFPFCTEHTQIYSKLQQIKNSKQWDGGILCFEYLVMSLPL